VEFPSLSDENYAHASSKAVIIPSVTSAEQVLADANAVTGRAWRVVAPLRGGLQGGAFRIEDDDGFYVLKWSPRTDWAARVAKGRTSPAASSTG
jgi:hypothetical protein